MHKDPNVNLTRETQAITQLSFFAISLHLLFQIFRSQNSEGLLCLAGISNKKIRQCADWEPLSNLKISKLIFKQLSVPQPRHARRYQTASKSTTEGVKAFAGTAPPDKEQRRLRVSNNIFLKHLLYQLGQKKPLFPAKFSGFVAEFPLFCFKFLSSSFCNIWFFDSTYAQHFVPCP